MIVLFSHTGTINGWTLHQMVVLLLGVYYIVQGAQAVVFEGSFARFMEHVRMGTLDFTLIKPVDSQFMISTRHIQIPQLGQACWASQCWAWGLCKFGGEVPSLGNGAGICRDAGCAVWRWCTACCWC